MATIHRLCQACIGQNLPQVNIIRGNDGYGFTICSDCPVRVQAVDPGSPAHLSGLCQGDCILQLNGIPVETWKCVDLAQAIRSCPSQIIMVVWRGLPELRSGGGAWPHQLLHNKATCRKLRPRPTNSKGSCRWGPGSGVRSSLGVLGSLRRDRAEAWEEEEGEQEKDEECSAQTTTLRGTRVTSAMGDNYIILSPVSPGSQQLRPVCGDGHQTLGRPYQTHPSRGQHLVLDSQPTLLRRPLVGRLSTLPPPASSSSSSSSSSSRLPVHYANYQNCTIVQSHLPSSEQEGYAALLPRTVIFPVFVQPLDLCSPDRSLLMSEEMILHQTDLLPTEVMVLIYTDLLLLTREDEFGRCNVLQSPLYLNTLQLREVSTEPLHLYLLQSCASRWCYVLSLEAFSLEQKAGVRLCLQDNIQRQLVPTETGHNRQVADLPSDLGLLTLGQSDLLYSASTPYSPRSPFSSPSPPPPPPFLSPPSRKASFSFKSSPLWKERGEEEEEEQERQQGEGESASETSECVGGVRGRSLLVGSPHLDLEEDECTEEELSCSPHALRRSLSEGSLFQEPRSPRFHSDSTIHRLSRPTAFDLMLGPTAQPPSPGTLKKQLTREGGTLHHMLLLLNGAKSPELKNHQFRKKTKTLAADVCSRLAFLRRRKISANVHGNSLEKALRNNRPSTEEVLKWAEGLEVLLANQYGVAVFRHFLRSEFSEENLDFWLAVEQFKRTHPLSKMAALGKKIYEDFISTAAVRQVNVDSSIRDLTNQSLDLGVSSVSFHLAQMRVFNLMETDSYPRFLKSRLYAQLADDKARAPSDPANRT